MAFLDIFKTKKRNEDPKRDSRYFSQLLNGGAEISQNDQHDRTFIEKGYRQNPTVHSIISMVCKNAAMAKWGIYKKSADNTVEPYTDILLQELLYSPNGKDTWNDFIQDIIGMRMLTGNAYIWGVEGTNEMTKGTIASMYILPSQYVDIRASLDGRAIAGYVVEYYGNTDQDLIPKKDVLHLKSFNPKYDNDGDFLYGQSPLQSCLRSLYINNDALDTSRSYLLNQGPRGILTMEQDETYGAMDEAQTNALRARFRSEHTGTKKAGELLVAPGKWKWEDIGSSAADLKLIEHYKISQNDICNAFNFPSILISDGQSTFSNQKEAKKALWTNTIIPALQEIEDGLNSWLSPRFGDDLCLKFNTNDIKELQEDIEKQANAITKLQNVITVNEARAMIGKAPMEGPEGDEIYRFVQSVDKEGSDAKQTDDNSKPKGSEEAKQ